MGAIRRERLSLLATVGLLSVSLIGFANVYTYSNADSFLGLTLKAQGANTLQVMVCFAVDAAAVVICGVLVLMCQSLPVIAAFKVATKWWLVIGGQAVAVLTSVIIVLWPNFTMITTSRALHGVAEAVYMIYSLILLVELSPRKHLGLGIASLTAGMTAGDTVGPVVGAVMFDQTGITGAFLLQAVINCLGLIAAVLMIPIWLFAPQQSKEQLLQAHSSTVTLPTHQSNSSVESTSSSTLPAPPQSKGTTCKDVSCSSKCQDSSSLKNDQDGKKAAEARSTDGCTAAGSKTTAVAIDHMQRGKHQQLQVQTYSSSADACSKSSSSGSLTMNKPLDKSIDSAGKPSSNNLKPTSSEDLVAVLGTDNMGEQQQQLPRLDLAAVLDTVKDPAIFNQCMLLLLEQAGRNSLTVVLPVAMGTRQLIVGMVYLANVAGSVSSPFLLDAYLAARGSKCATHRLSAWISLVMGAACAAVVPLSKVLPALVIVLLVAGSAQAGIEALTYINIAKRLDRLQRSTAVHVSMAMYLLAQTMGSGVGSLVGSAVLQQPWDVQVAVQAAVCGLGGLYGFALGVGNHRGWWCKDTGLLPASSSNSSELGVISSGSNAQHDRSSGSGQQAAAAAVERDPAGVSCRQRQQRTHKHG